MSVKLPNFPELDAVKKLAARQEPWLRAEVLSTVRAGSYDFPIYGLVLGSADRSHPTFGLFGGIHGLEQVGVHVTISYLQTVCERLSWDANLRRQFESARLVSIPMINPTGVYLQTRSNGNGVDLMRNAPMEAVHLSPYSLVGGHRISPKLPWYRGKEGQAMEIEAQTLIDFIRREMFSARHALSLDCHSGFGLRDRLWHPYAKTKSDFPLLTQALRFKDLLDRNIPHHVYKIEAQSQSYTAHGDLYDYLVDEHLRTAGQRGAIYIPWTLEMGSWLWVKKNPLQLFRPLGLFNPLVPHRKKRVLRRHVALLDFFFNAVQSEAAWAG